MKTIKKTIIILYLLLLSFLAICQNQISSAQLQADTKLLWKALNELHPGLYRHTDTTTLTNDYQQLLQDFATDKNEQEVFLLLSEFVSKIKCGHTYLNPFNQKNKIITNILNEKVLLPFTFSIIDQKIVVEKSLSDAIIQHNIITHINDIPVNKIIDSLIPFIKADGNRKMKKIKDLEVTLTSKFEYWDYYFAMIYDIKNNTTITLSNGENKNIQLLTKEERNLVYNDRYPNTTDGPHKLWNQSFEKNYAYLKLGTFVTWKMSFDWEKYLDNFFNEVESRKIPNLIIDVRGNEGGLTEVNDYLIKKLAKKEGQTVFRKPHLAYKKVSDEIKPHVSTWSKWFYNTSLWTKKLNREYRTIRFSANKARKIKQNKKAFQGQTFLLVDASNSSATFLLAETCKENQYAQLVGTETGGTKKGITAGQIFFLTLPNTKIEIDIPLIGQYPMEVLPDEGIQPDGYVKRTLNGIISGRDEQLEKVIELLEIQ